MTFEFPILSLITFLPIIGALFIMIMLSGSDKVVASNSKAIALFTTFATFVLSIVMYVSFDVTSADFQFIEQREWLPSFGVYYKLGVDGISLFFILLTTFLGPICILAVWKNIKIKIHEFFIAFLILETMVLGAFMSLDTILFYIFFEAALIPMFFIIGIWGGAHKIYAAMKFFLYTFLGSIFMLVAFLYLANMHGTTDIEVLHSLDIDPEVQKYIFLALLASFAVKLPIFPLHTWLPDAHVEAPTSASVFLTGVMLKMGGYGFLRLSLPMLPDAVAYFTPMMFVLAGIAVIYTSLIALAQKDMKRLIAYASVANMGYVVIGLFAFNQHSVEGAIIHMLSHGLISAGLFLIVGMLYNRMHNRDIELYGGVGQVMPKLSAIFLLLSLAAIGLPATSGFVGEFLILLGAFGVNAYIAAVAAFGIILSAVYMLYFYKRVVTGEAVQENIKKLKDIDALEILMLVPIVIVIFWMGVRPVTFTEAIAPSVTKVIARSAK